MTREKLKKVVKLRSLWEIDRRIGDYTLPNCKKLSDYVKGLVVSQLELDYLTIAADGSIQPGGFETYQMDGKEMHGYVIYKMFGNNEYCDYEEMDCRINKLVREIVCRNV